jgi:chemotaxis protein CheD
MTRQKARVPFADVSDLAKAAIHVGEIFVGRKPTVVQTLLGSCVSVCLIDRKARIGGMNHILLPGKPDLHSFDASARYGVNAMEMLIGGIQRAGAARKRLEAKVFGGANVLTGLDKTFNPGFRNGTFAMEFLELEKIPVIGHDIGGFNARRIYLRTDTGEVFMKRIPRYQASNIVIEEKEYRRRVEGELSQEGRVTLFNK